MFPTVDKKGVCNLAPFSFFTAICADPMLICFSPMRKGTNGEKKDTLHNIEQTKEFVINIVNESIAEQMNITSQDLSPEQDEFIEAGFTKEKSATLKVPRVKESEVHLECSLYEVRHYGEHAGAGSLVVGKVQHVHVADHLYEDGKINTEKLNPIGRLAGQMYTKPMAETFVLERKR
ncbi:flavin reductase family protein [Bacillus carboniphilus]|uniref:flavin reductase family protein n=1 Tax=Bacillus carboniphilus TaxID=86663 RepID=UPI0035320635